MSKGYSIKVGQVWSDTRFKAFDATITRVASGRAYYYAGEQVGSIELDEAGEPRYEFWRLIKDIR